MVCDMKIQIYAKHFHFIRDNDPVLGPDLHTRLAHRRSMLTLWSCQVPLGKLTWGGRAHQPRPAGTSPAPTKS